MFRDAVSCCTMTWSAEDYFLLHFHVVEMLHALHNANTEAMGCSVYPSVISIAVTGSKDKVQVNSRSLLKGTG